MRKICFITSTRADYGLLKEPMKALKASGVFELQLLVTGSHLSEKFGSTFKEIEHDGFTINHKIDLGDLKDSDTAMANQVSRVLEGTTTALSELKPDLMIVLGDRYEILGAAQAAFFLKIPLMHLHGGEVTEGALDDSIRHSITKLSNYHITSTEVYRDRVLQLGEDPEKTFYLGSTGLENLISEKLMTKDEVEQSLNFSMKKQNLLITFHPVTANQEDASELIKALSHFKDIGQIITLPNSDPGYEKIRSAFLTYADQNDNVLASPSLGQVRYNSTMKIVDLVVGNSSSGIVEAPFSGTRTLNIGTRQKGRVMDLKKITSVPCRAQEIQQALSKLLADNTYSKTPSYIYGDGSFSKKLLELLQEISKFDHQKKFFDVNVKL